jgi:hypothetical protein
MHFLNGAMEILTAQCVFVSAHGFYIGAMRLLNGAREI